jgi:hypothetical protein|tara:strand:- start:1501 stop:1929 length:429 start_codon:yes stop_codon:yes gene_type:complete
MAPRRRKTKRRRSRAVSLINALEAYTYASILSQGVAGTSPWGMLTGDTDIGTTTVSTGMGAYSQSIQQVVGAKEISLGDIVSNPGLALSAMGENLQANLIPMAVSSLVTGVSFRFGKRLLRRPISNINRNIMKPLLGAGIKL